MHKMHCNIFGCGVILSQKSKNRFLNLKFLFSKTITKENRDFLCDK